MLPFLEQTATALVKLIGFAAVLLTQKVALLMFIQLEWLVPGNSFLNKRRDSADWLAALLRLVRSYHHAKIHCYFLPLAHATERVWHQEPVKLILLSLTPGLLKLITKIPPRISFKSKYTDGYFWRERLTGQMSCDHINNFDLLQEILLCPITITLLAEVSDDFENPNIA